MPSKNEIVAKLKLKQKEKAKNKMKQQHKKYKKISNKKEQPKVEGGEGSRGGVVVGYTNTGAPKYEENTRIPGVSRSKTKPEPKKVGSKNKEEIKEKLKDKLKEKEDKVKKSILSEFITKFKNKG